MAASKAAVGSAVAPMVALLAWAIASSVMIVGHRIVLVDEGFHFPLTLTAAEQFASALAGLLLSKAGLLPLGPAPRLTVFVARVLPSVLSFAGTLYLGNLAYLSLSMAFIQMLKAMVPAITLVLCLFMGLERFSVPVLGSIVAISLGTGLTAFLEMGTVAFDMVGFTAFAASAVLESLRCVLIEVLMGRLRYNAAEVLVYMGFPTGVILALAAWLVEGEGLRSHGWRVALTNTPLMAGLALSSASVNLFSFLAIRLTSSLTFKTVGCMKNAFVVWLGVLMGDTVSGMQLFGYAIAMLGFVYYTLITHHKRQASLQHQRRTTSKKEN